MSEAWIIDAVRTHGAMLSIGVNKPLINRYTFRTKNVTNIACCCVSTSAEIQRPMPSATTR